MEEKLFNDNQLGEDRMTEYQFRRYEEYRDKCERLTEEIKSLRNSAPQAEPGMTDYQFQQYELLRNQRDALKRKNESIVQTVKRCVEDGKSPEEILSAIDAIATQPE